MPGNVPPRLHVILARDATVGVVIRRGPNKQTRLILWDTATDRLTPGQWLKAREYERRYDLSPDGNNECLGVCFPRLRRDGWREVGEVYDRKRFLRTREKSAAGMPLRLIKHCVSSLPNKVGVGVYHDEHEVDLSDGHGPVVLPGAEWADFDHRGRLVYAAGRKLWEAAVEDGTIRPRELADFRAMSFEAIELPLWAREE